MADLDDFFAKKDRKKGKTVKKFQTPDEVSKKIDDTKQKVEAKPRRERIEGEDGVRRDEDEWREYEETIKDYTGLKIQHLTGANAAQGAGGETEGGQDEDDGEDSGDNSGGPKTTRQKGPWNKSQEGQAPAPVPKPQVQPQPKPEPKEPPPREAGAKQYVAPMLRNKQPDQMERRPMSRRQARNAPDIHNDDYFPVLGAPAKARSTGGGWSTAGGGGSAHPPSHTHTATTTGNRFTQLTHDS